MKFERWRYFSDVHKCLNKIEANERLHVRIPCAANTGARRYIQLCPKHGHKMFHDRIPSIDNTMVGSYREPYQPSFRWEGSQHPRTPQTKAMCRSNACSHKNLDCTSHVVKRHISKNVRLPTQQPRGRVAAYSYW